MDDGINNVKIVAIGKSEHEGDNSEWTNGHSIPVLVDPSPYDTWINWGADQRDLFFLDANGKYVADFNISTWDYNTIYNTIMELIEGCTDQCACNYDVNAAIEDGSCEYTDHTLHANHYWDFARWVHDYYKWYEYIEGDSSWNSLRNLFIDPFDSTYKDIWENGYNIKFTYNGAIDSSNSYGFNDLFKNLCGNELNGDAGCLNNIENIDLTDSNGDTILIIQDSLFYESVYKSNHFAAGWMDNDNLYVVESDVGNTGMTPHKLYYGSIYEDYIADNGENDCLELDKLHAPSDFSINQVYPNPFNPVTTIHYTLPENMNINILVYDIRGRHLTTLFNDFQITGTYTINWDASLYPSGIYFIMMVSDNFKQTEKVILVK